MPFHLIITDRTDRNETSSKIGSQEEDMELPLFNLSAIATATENFSVNNKLGEGGFGSVYRVSFPLIFKFQNNKQ